MTDSATAARRVAALTLIPTSVAIFGAGLAWANGHDPMVASAPESESESAAPATDPQLAIAQAKVDDARDKLAQLQAEVNARNAERVAIQEQQAASVVPPPAAGAPAAAAAPVLTSTKTGTTVKTSTTTKVTQPIVAAAPAAVPVQTTTKASKK